MLRLLTDAKIHPLPALAARGLILMTAATDPGTPFAYRSSHEWQLPPLPPPVVGPPVPGVRRGQLASSCSLQTACCHELSLAGTDSLSIEDWKEKAGTSCGVMASLLSSQALPLFCLQPCGQRWRCFLRAGNVFQIGLKICSRAPV